MKYRIVVVLIFLVSSLYAEGEDVLTLKGAVERALDRNTGYLIALEQARESKYKVRETWGMLWPSLSSDISVTFQDADEGMSSYTDGQYDITFINGQWQVNPGTFYHSLISSRKGHIMATLEARRVRADTVIQTIKNYFSIMLARESIELSEESVRALAENLRVVTVGYRKGTVSRLDYLNARVSLANERVKLINARNNLMTARAVMNMHLGREIDEPIRIEKSFRDMTEEELAFTKLSEKDEEEMTRKLVAEALRNRPELIQVRVQKEMEKQGEWSARSVYVWPTIFIQGQWKTTKTMPEDNLDPLMKQYFPDEWNKSWSITLGASYSWGSLVPLDRSHAKVKQAKSRQEQSRLQMEELIRSIHLEVKSNLLKLKSASLSLQAQKGNVETARASLGTAVVQFRNGIIDNTKLLEANIQLKTAQNLYIQAIHDYHVARAELNRAVGREYFPIE
jgi:outer membrane protein TolC